MKSDMIVDPPLFFLHYAHSPIWGIATDISVLLVCSRRISFLVDGNHSPGRVFKSWITGGDTAFPAPTPPRFRHLMPPFSSVPGIHSQERSHVARLCHRCRASLFGMKPFEYFWTGSGNYSDCF
ncbi:hypothetical protein TWF225_003938 [Orbilia oligospora]|nr:hypothetical protein TWF751_000031 [Orbilia oligospora]KAF3188176.1 hypothetical protein TWF225_003938 [Orbilia oligospora]KAF3239390.1 hypothetical protein TWF217_001305 [Orbilia oligospora]KAF3295585.1 hypothetical protein TWF132_001621 [Orbilia oligospora]